MLDNSGRLNNLPALMTSEIVKKISEKCRKSRIKQEKYYGKPIKKTGKICVKKKPKNRKKANRRCQKKW